MEEVINNDGTVTMYPTADDFICDTRPGKRSMSVPPGMNIVFLSSDRDALRPDLGNRRFLAVSPDWPYSQHKLLKAIKELALKITPRNDPPMAWIIEREGRVTMVHYENCAKHAAENGYTVTPYYSQVTK